MSSQPGRVAFKGAIARFAEADPTPLVIRNMPFAESLQATITGLDTEQRCLCARFTCGPENIQGAGVVQGGVLSAMLDLSMALLCLAELPAELTCATAQLNTHFLQPAAPGQYRCEAEIEKAGRRVIFGRATLFHTDGDTAVASATAVFSVLGKSLER